MQMSMLVHLACRWFNPPQLHCFARLSRLLTWLHCMQIAAAAVMVASFTLANISWTPTLQHYCRCTAAELRAPAKLLHGLFAHARGSPLPAIREKFSHPKHKCVASVPAPDGLPEWLFQDGGRRLTPAASAATPPRRTEAPRPMWSSQSISSLSHCLAAPGGPGGIKAYHGSN